MRKTIARRLVESKSQVPHFYLTADADMEAAMAFREQVKEVHGAKLSVNDLIIKAAALALRRVPEANASFSDEGISATAGWTSAWRWPSRTAWSPRSSAAPT